MATKKLVYIMENLVEVDTRNKNTVFFCNYFKEKGIDVTFLTTQNGENRSINSLGNNIPVIKLQKRFSIKNKEKQLFFPFRYLFTKRNEFDAVWCYLSRPSSFYATIMKLFFSKRLLVKCDSVVPKKTWNIFKALWRYLTVSLPLKNADFIVAESPRVYRIVENVNSRAVLLPNGIPLSSFENIDKKLKSIKKKNTVLSVGRVEPIKGTLDLIDAFALFHKKHPDWRLNIVGPTHNSTYLSEVKTRIKDLFGKNNPVCLTGPKFGDDLYKSMKEAKIFCIASHKGGDGLSNVLPQAMYFGCHPVVTKVGDLDSQVAGLNVRIAKPCNTRDLARSLEWSTSNLIKEKLLKAHVKSKFVWEENLKKFEPVITQIKNG